MGLLNSDVKIHETLENSVKVFIISYPRKNSKQVLIGMDIVRNILKDNNIIVNVDNSLSFLKKDETAETVDKLREALKQAGIPFEYRVSESQASNTGVLGRLFSLPKKNNERELFTFKLDSRFFDENLFDILLQLGCEIYVPFEFKEEIVQEVFNRYFHEQSKRFSTFKYVIFVSDYLSQAALRTKALNIEDVQKLCIVNQTQK
jgi:hypothetical protein